MALLMCCITKCLFYLAHVLNCLFYLELSMCCFAKHVLYLALVLNYVSHLALLICCIVKKLLYLTLVFNLVCCALCPIVLVTFVACFFPTFCSLAPLLFGTSVICHLCYLAVVTTNPTDLFLTMYPFCISTDEHAPPKLLMTKSSG